jgi:hypothetical protein
MDAALIHVRSGARLLTADLVLSGGDRSGSEARSGVFSSRPANTNISISHQHHHLHQPPTPPVQPFAASPRLLAMSHTLMHRGELDAGQHAT